MNTIMFTVPGEPVGKGRPRFVRATGRTYTPEKTVRYESIVRLCYQEQVKVAPFSRDMPLYICLEVYQQIPKSVSKRKREQMIARKIRPTKKPDCSNILKAVEDALNGVAYADDSQIVQVHVAKFFSEYPEVIVKVGEVKPVG